MWRLLRGERQMAGLYTVDGLVHPIGLKQLVNLLNEQAEYIERLEQSVATNAQMREKLTAEVDRLRAQHSRALDALGVKPHD